MQLSRRAIDAGAMDFPVRGSGSLVSTRTQASTWWRRASKGCTPTAAHQEPHALMLVPVDISAADVPPAVVPWSGGTAAVTVDRAAAVDRLPEVGEVGPGAAGRIPDEEGHGETLVGVLVPGASVT